MTNIEFNKKYEKYMETPDCPGLCINNKDLIAFLDKKFKKFIKIPDFTWAQIKAKFGGGRFYCTKVPFQEVYEIEEYITKLKL